jgi:hypothetical protein
VARNEGRKNFAKRGVPKIESLKKVCLVEIGQADHLVQSQSLGQVGAVVGVLLQIPVGDMKKEAAAAKDLVLSIEVAAALGHAVQASDTTMMIVVRGRGAVAKAETKIRTEREVKVKAEIKRETKAEREVTAPAREAEVNQIDGVEVVLDRAVNVKRSLKVAICPGVNWFKLLTFHVNSLI